MTRCRLVRTILRQLSAWRLSFLRFSGRGVPSRVWRGEDLSLFCSKDDVNRSLPKAEWFVKYQAFHPRRRKEDQRLETSVCRTTILSRPEVWQICAQYFDAAQRSRNDHAIGRAVGPAYGVKKAKLALHADGVPHAYHANVIDWYDDPNLNPAELRKHHWMHAAQTLADHFPFEHR